MEKKFVLYTALLMSGSFLMHSCCASEGRRLRKKTTKLNKVLKRFGVVSKKYDEASMNLKELEANGDEIRRSIEKEEDNHFCYEKEFLGGCVCHISGEKLTDNDKLVEKANKDYRRSRKSYRSAHKNTSHSFSKYIIYAAKNPNQIVSHKPKIESGKDFAEKCPEAKEKFKQGLEICLKKHTVSNCKNAISYIAGKFLSKEQSDGVLKETDI